MASLNSQGFKDDASSGFGTFGLPDRYFGGQSGNFKQQKVNFSNYIVHNESRDIYQERYLNILGSCETVDDLIATNLNNINSRKSQIQDLGKASVWDNNPKTYATPSAALAAIDPIYYDAHTSSDNEACTVISGGLTGFTGSVGAAVSQSDGLGGVASGVISINASGTLVVEGVSGTFTTTSPIFINNVESEVTVTSVEYTGMTKIRADAVLITKYDDLEPPDDSVDNPYGNVSNPILSGGTNGVGSAQTFFKNAIDTGDGTNPTIGAATNYGKVYTFDTSTSGNDGQIASKLTEIGILRNDAESNTDSGHALKQQKTSYAIIVWSYERGNATVTQHISGMDNLSNILDDL